MVPSLSASGFGRRGRSNTSSSNEPSNSSASERKHSSSSHSRKASGPNSQMDDWSDGFTGIVDLDRRMRELAMSEQGFSAFGVRDSFEVYEPFSPSDASWTDRLQARRHSSSDSRTSSASPSSLATGHSNASIGPSSCSAVTVTSRFSQDSRRQSSLLSKRRSSTANTIDSFEAAHSPLQLAPLPAAPSVFGNFTLADATAISKSAQPSSTFSPSSWSSPEEQEPRTPLAAVASSRQQEPLTPGTAAAATWIDPSAPSYFPATHGGKYKTRSLRKKAARAPLPRLVSGEVVSSPAADCSEACPRDAMHGTQNSRTDPWQHLDFDPRFDPTSDHSDRRSSGTSSPPSPSATHALKRSAQSLALNLRFKIIGAKRRVIRTGQAVAGRASPSSQRSSAEGSPSI